MNYFIQMGENRNIILDLSGRKRGVFWFIQSIVILSLSLLWCLGWVRRQVDQFVHLRYNEIFFTSRRTSEVSLTPVDFPCFPPLLRRIMSFAKHDPGEIGTAEERAKLLKEIMAQSQTFVVRSASPPTKKPEAKRS